MSEAGGPPAAVEARVDVAGGAGEPPAILAPASEIAPTTPVGDGTPSSPQPPPPVWWRRPAVRVLAARLVLRLVTLAVIVVLLRVFSSDFRAAGDAYLDWIRSLGPGGGPAVFWVVACVFCGLSPTGYLPAVAAGATFHYEESIPIAYTSVLVGAVVNVGLVRGLLWQSGWLRKRCGRRAGATLGGLERALLAKPVRMVALLRLPFLGNGTLNYLLSLSPLPATWPGFWTMMAGNALGMAPGAVLFAVAGSQVRSLAQLIINGGGSATAVGVFVAVTVTVIVSIAAVLIITRRMAAAERAQAAAAKAAAADAAAAAGGSPGYDDGTPSVTAWIEGGGSDRAPSSPSSASTQPPGPRLAAASPPRSPPRGQPDLGSSRAHLVLDDATVDDSARASPSPTTAAAGAARDGNCVDDERPKNSVVFVCFA